MSAEQALLPQDQGQAIQGQNLYSTPASLSQFYVNPQQLVFSQNPFTDLASTNFAIVNIKYPCCTFCSSLCGFTYNFDTYLSTAGGIKYLFRSVSKIDCSVCCVSDIISRFGKCISYGKQSLNELNSDGGAQLVELDKNKNCACYGCCDILMDVNIFPGKKCAGILKIQTAIKKCCSCSLCGSCCVCFTCDCYNYTYCCEILTPDNRQKYVIQEKRCCLSCASGKNCGLSFTINDCSGMSVGSIEGNGKCCGGEYTFKIIFPQSATIEDKLCLLNAIYAIDTFGIY